MITNLIENKATDKTSNTLIWSLLSGMAVVLSLIYSITWLTYVFVGLLVLLYLIMTVTGAIFHGWFGDIQIEQHAKKQPMPEVSLTRLLYSVPSILLSCLWIWYGYSWLVIFGSVSMIIFVTGIKKIYDRV